MVSFVRAFGAHPFASPGHYTEDRECTWQVYVRAADAWAKQNDTGPLQEYLDRASRRRRAITSSTSSVSGMRRLLALNEY